MKRGTYWHPIMINERISYGTKFEIVGDQLVIEELCIAEYSGWRNVITLVPLSSPKGTSSDKEDSMSAEHRWY